MAANLTALTASLAALQQQVKDSQNASNVSWLLICGCLVFFMQCGFGMLEAGAVRSKATQVILLKNLFDVSLGGMLWWLCGFAFTNGTGSAFIGYAPPPGKGSLFATAGLDGELSASSGMDWALAFFQFTFAAAAATIVSGAVAERAQLPAYLAFSALMSGFVYPVVAHWVWSSSGWLSVYNPVAAQRFLSCGVIDFAGAGVVHMTGGVAALCGAKVIGPRTGRFDADGQPVPMPGHSSVLQVLGTFILWLGWYGFNAGSTLGLDHGKARTAARVVLITTLAAAGGGMSSVLMHRFRAAGRTWDVTAMCNGILAGLVSVTAGCATVHPWAGFLMGGMGGCIYRLASQTIRRLGIDDPLDAAAVHLSGGLWGLLATALLSTPAYTREVLRCDCPGLFYGDARLLGAALIFVLVHVMWVGTLSTLLFLLLRYLGCLRAPTHADHAYSWGGGSERGTFGGSASGGNGNVSFPPTHQLERPTAPPDHSATCSSRAASKPAPAEIEVTDIQVRVAG